MLDNNVGTIFLLPNVNKKKKIITIIGNTLVSLLHSESKIVKGQFC